MTVVPRRSSGVLRCAATSLVALMLSAAGPAAAQAPFTSLPDGRYIIEFAGYRFALMPSAVNNSPSVDLCFAGEPEVWPRGKGWDRRIEWPLSRILADASGFRAELAQAKSISVLQIAAVTQSKAEAGDGPPAPVLAKDVRMFLSINASDPADQPCYGYGERGRRDPVADGPRRTFDWPEHDRRRLETFGPLTAYLGTENHDFAVGKIEAQDRGFPARNPLYVWCSWPDCRQYARSTDRVVLIEFSFVATSEGIDPSQWSMLDRYFHNFTHDVFLGHVPDGVD